MSTTDGSKAQLDPITFEVLRHKLDEIVAEAYHTIGRVSGSPVVYEAGDHQEAICTANGDLAAFGAGVLHWVRSISEGVRHVNSQFAESPGFADGDQFLVNDSYIASVHASDVQLLAPIFYEGRLIAWAGSASHQQDTGGVTPGGHHVTAEDVFAEGFQTPGLKLVEGGVIRKDIEQTFANMIRQPELGLLDVRAKIASNNVMRERLLGLAARYGVDTILALFDQLIDHSESRLRSRLAGIADGHWTATNHIEAIAEPSLSVNLTLTKRGDTLTYDFTGSSPQSAGAENIGVPGAVSCAMSPVIIALCHDLPWNEGLFKPVDFVLPEGSIVNPVRPAPLSANIPSGACTLVTTSAQTAVAKMLRSTERFGEDAAAVTGGSFNFPVFAGLGRDGTPFATLVLDGLAGGGGALDGSDGDSSAHNAWSVKTMVANVETNELLYPLMYLWRREVTDSPGAGQFRGGAGLSLGIMPWKVPELVLITVGVGTQSRGGLGLAGGYPGAHAPVSVLRGTGVADGAFAAGTLPTTVAALGGELEAISPKGLTMLPAHDVLHMRVSSGGGGVGDPLKRDPAAVRTDVTEGVVSAEMAAAVYGVVLDANGGVDEGATTERRGAIRDGRLARARASALGATTGRCSGCGETRALLYDDPIATGEPAAFAPENRLFALRHACCSACGELLDVEMVLAEAGA
jgi:N-methylhydantoinase B